MEQHDPPPLSPSADSVDRELSLDMLALREYTMLKAEQISRIAQRDHLLYATLGVIGAIFYFSLSEHGILHSLLVIPWVCFILGWTYLCNDEKVSAIREYLTKLAGKLASSTEVTAQAFEWERSHRLGRGRRRYKIMQLFVDLTTFVFSGFAALLAYVRKVPTWSNWQYAAVAFALLIMIILAREFIAHFSAETRGA
ncbi:MAG: hypothetical protein QOH88_1460 [Verrucomicrobiota bacterium]